MLLPSVVEESESLQLVFEVFKYDFVAEVEDVVFEVHLRLRMV
jgi:hypothetical protein